MSRIVLMLALFTAAPQFAAEPRRVDAFSDALPAGAVGRLGSVRGGSQEFNERYTWGHRDTVSSLVFHPSGKKLFSASRGDETIRCWNLAQLSKRQSAVLSRTAHLDPLILADHGRLLPVRHATDYGLAVSVWDVLTSRYLGSIPLHQEPYADIDFNRSLVSPDSPTMAISDAYESVQLVDLRRGRIIASTKSSTSASAPLSFAPGGKKLLDANADGEVVVWDPATGKRHKASSTQSTHLAQRYFVCRGEPLIGDRVRGGPLRPIDARIGECVLSTDGRYLLGRTASTSVETLRKNELSVVETASGQIIRKIALPGTEMSAFAIAANSSLIAVGCSDGTIVLYPFQSPKAREIDSIRASDLWTDLGKDDARKAFEAIETLIANPREAIEVIRVRLVVFPERVGSSVQGDDSLWPLTGRQMQLWRAVEILERIGSRDAFELLKELSKLPDALLRVQSGDALMRLMAVR